MHCRITDGKTSFLHNIRLHYFFESIAHSSTSCSDRAEHVRACRMRVRMCGEGTYRRRSINKRTHYRTFRHCSLKINYFEKSERYLIIVFKWSEMFEYSLKALAHGESCTDDHELIAEWYCCAFVSRRRLDLSKERCTLRSRCESISTCMFGLIINACM
jgi:hypothetical protein